MTVALVAAFDFVFMTGFLFFISLPLITEASLIPLVSAISPIFLVVSMVGVGRRGLNLHAVMTGTSSKEGRHLEGVVQDKGNVEVETETADGSDEMMGLKRGWMA